VGGTGGFTGGQSLGESLEVGGSGLGGVAQTPEIEDSQESQAITLYALKRPSTGREGEREKGKKEEDSSSLL
jgi:hypothetical protein